MPMLNQLLAPGRLLSSGQPVGRLVPAAGLRGAGLVSELGAFTSAPSCTPMPSRSTSSPPSHSVTSASAAPLTDSATAARVGRAGRRRRAAQLAANRQATTRYPSRWCRRIYLARELDGMMENP